MSSQQDIQDGAFSANSSATSPPPDITPPDAKAPAPPPKERRQTWDYLKSRFDKEHWFGSAVLIAHMTSAYQTIRAALVRKVHGEIKPDRTRFYSGIVPIAGYGWSFLSERGAEFPKGRTLLKRIMYTLAHPSQCSAQFEFILHTIPNAMATANNFIKGGRAHGLGLKQGEKAYTPEKVRLYTGLLQIVGWTSTGYGHFRERKPEPPLSAIQTLDDAYSGKKRNFAGVIKTLWKHDRTLLLGTLVTLTMDALSLTEGLKKTHGSKEESRRILKAGAYYVISDLAYDAFIFKRLFTSNFDQETAAKQNTEIGKETAHQETPTASFTQKIQPRNPAPKIPERKHSFTELVQQATLPDLIEWSP
ncbi:MAG TPA: hypothetical protein VFT64_12545 [Rickettsiales bacterium]|nr:hypothetical protein [Rickettsiales bacterium]